MKELLLKNSLTGVAQVLINFVLLMVAVPVFINLLGSEAYGVFSLVMIAGNLNTFTNLGLSQALLKFLAEQGKGIESDHDIIVSIGLMLFVLLPLIGGGIYFWQFILVKLFGLSLPLALKAKWLFIDVLSANFFIMLGRIPKAILDSLQKIYITSYLQILYSFIYWGLIILAVIYQHDLDHVGIAVVLAAFVWFTAISIYAFLVWKLPKCEYLSQNIVRVTKKQLSYGSKIYTGGLISFFFEPLTKIMISHFFGVVEVGYFDIASKIKAQIQSIFQKILAPLLPLLAQWGNGGKTKYLIHDLEKKILLITVPFSCIIWFTISPFLNLWLGPHSDLIDITAKIIIVSFLLFSTSALPAYVFFVACGFPQLTIYAQLINVVVNIFTILILYKTLGFYAVSVGSAVAILGSFVVIVYSQNKILGETIFNEQRFVIKITGISVVLLVLGHLAVTTLSNNFLSLLVVPLIILSASLLQYRFTGMVSREDIHYYLGSHPILDSICNLLVLR